MVGGRESRLTPHTALIVDPDDKVAGRLRAIAENADYRVLECQGFERARDVLRSGRPISALVANVRLGEYNGIHLVYLGKLHHPEIRAFVYARPHDAMLAREAQHAAAFYQRQGLMILSLGSFLRAGLPSQDRRAVIEIDRRATFRGGRRTTDVGNLSFALSAI